MMQCHTTWFTVSLALLPFVLPVNPISSQSAQVLVFPSLRCTLHTDVKQEGHACIQVLLICFSFSSSYGGWLRKGLSDDSRADKVVPRCGPQHKGIWLKSQQVKHREGISTTPASGLLWKVSTDLWRPGTKCQSCRCGCVTMFSCQIVIVDFQHLQRHTDDLHW